MASKDIDPAVVVEISNKVRNTLTGLNQKYDIIQSDVLSIIENHWYNDNALRIMPEIADNLTKTNAFINSLLSSIGSALGEAAQTWALANGSPGYNIVPIITEPRTLTCNVKNEKDGHKGMDVDELQVAVNQTETIESDMIELVNDLQKAGEVTGFCGGIMQTNLNKVCNQVKKEIKKSINSSLEIITDNTGTTKSSNSEPTFLIQ